MVKIYSERSNFRFLERGHLARLCGQDARAPSRSSLTTVQVLKTYGSNDLVQKLFPTHAVVFSCFS
jgi:hypothetical protein